MPHVSTAMFAKTYGHIISFRIVSQNVVVVSSTEAAMEVLKTQDHILFGRILPDILRQPIKDFYLIWSPDENGIRQGPWKLCWKRKRIFLDHSFESNMTNAQINILIMELFVA
nr:cytochrome P450 [Tanacetum cinerariifolium]